MTKPLTKKDRSNIFKQLKELDICQVVLNFEGGNDEGGLVDGSWFFNDGSELDLYTVEMDNACKIDLIELMSAPIYSKYGSFDGEPVVDLTLTYDVEKETVTLEGYESYTESKTIKEKL